MFRLLKVSVFTIVLLSLAVVASVSGIFITYFRLTAEEPVARITFEEVGDQEYNAYLTLPGNDIPGKYVIYGDQWRIDAEFVKIQPWANILGVDSRYKLVRLEGRYQDIEDQNTRPHMAYDLGATKGIDIGKLVADWNFLIDAEYGSSTFTDIEVANTYTVYKSQFGLLVREDAAQSDATSNGAVDGLFNWLFGSK